MSLLIDTFWTEASTRLAQAGWIITEGTRYDPTHVIGVTPTGKAFALDIVDGVVTVTVAGRTRSTTIASREDWEDGTKSVELLLATHASFPANQR